MAAGQLIASLAKRMFNKERYPEQLYRPDRPPISPATQSRVNKMNLPPIQEASASHDPAQSNPEEEASHDETEQVKLTKPIKPTFRHIVANEKSNSIPVNFQKNNVGSNFKVSGFNLDQHNACLRKLYLAMS